MWAWIILAVIVAVPVLMLLWVRAHPDAFRAKIPRDADGDWLAATFGLTAGQCHEVRATVMEGEIVDPDELRPAAVAYARRLQERRPWDRWLGWKSRRAELGNLNAAPGPSPRRQAIERIPWFLP
jgi:hypothetical protein